MEQKSAEQAAGWTTIQVYAMAAVCLAVGLAVGYLFRGSAPARPADPQPVQAAQPTSSEQASPHAMPSMEQMKAMADKKASPLIERIKSEPKNADLLVQIGDIYQATHQFKEAAVYYGKSLEIKPRNVAIRTELASCLFYGGDADAALAQLQQSLKDSPQDANSLFNLGMIRLKGKNDKAGAIAAWQQLLKTDLSSEKRSVVEKMIAEAQQ
jgi:cytochrome c-type biogenesis protein CcmH/NrfG